MTHLQGSKPRSYFPTNKTSADSEKIQHVSERYREKDEMHITSSGLHWWLICYAKETMRHNSF